MLKYKALFKSMTDNLKDAEMMMEWAKHLKETDPMVSKVLMDSIEYRLHSEYPKLKEVFHEVCKGSKEGEMLCETTMDHMEDWYEHVDHTFKHLKK